MSTLNAALLRRTMEHLERHPELHEPYSFDADFAAWAIRLHDPTLRAPERVDDGYGVRLAEHWVIDGMWAPAYAQRLLGLTDAQRWALFDHCTDAVSLRVMVDALLGSSGGVEGAELDRIARDSRLAHPGQM